MDFLRDVGYRCNKYFGHKMYDDMSGAQSPGWSNLLRQLERQIADRFESCAASRGAATEELTRLRDGLQRIGARFCWIECDPSKEEELRKSLQPAVEGEESSIYRIFLESMRSVCDQPSSIRPVGSSGPPPLRHSSFLSLKQIIEGDMLSILTELLLTDKSKGGRLQSTREFRAILAAEDDEGSLPKEGQPLSAFLDKVEALSKKALGKGAADGASLLQKLNPPSRGILQRSGLHASSNAVRAVGKLSSVSVPRSKPSQIPLVAKGKENNSLGGFSHASEHLGKGGSRIAIFKWVQAPQPGGTNATRRMVSLGICGSKANEPKQKAHVQLKHTAAPVMGKASTKMTTAPTFNNNLSAKFELVAREEAKGARTAPAADEPDQLLCALDVIQEAERAASVFLGQLCASWNGALSMEGERAVNGTGSTDMNVCTRGATQQPEGLIANTPAAAAPAARACTGRVDPAKADLPSNGINRTLNSIVTAINYTQIQHAAKASAELLAQQLRRCSEPSIKEALQSLGANRMEVADEARRSRREKLYAASSGAVDCSMLPYDEEGCGDNGIALLSTPTEGNKLATKPHIWRLIASWCTGADVAHLGLATVSGVRTELVKMLRQVKTLLNMMHGEHMAETSKCVVSQGAHMDGKLFFHSCIKPNLGDMLPSIIARIEADFGDCQMVACPCGCTESPTKAHQQKVPKPLCVGSINIEEVCSRLRNVGGSTSRLVAPRVSNKRPEHLAGINRWRPLVDPSAVAAAAEKVRKQAAVGSHPCTQGKGFGSTSTRKGGADVKSFQFPAEAGTKASGLPCVAPTKDSTVKAGETGRRRAVLQNTCIPEEAPPANQGGNAGSTAAPPVTGPLVGSVPPSLCPAPPGNTDGEMWTSSFDLGCESGAEDSLSNETIISETLQPNDPKPEKCVQMRLTALFNNSVEDGGSACKLLKHRQLPPGSCSAPMGGTARYALLGHVAATAPASSTRAAGVKPIQSAPNQSKAARKAAMLGATKTIPADGSTGPTARTAVGDADCCAVTDEGRSRSRQIPTAKPISQPVSLEPSRTTQLCTKSGPQSGSQQVGCIQPPQALVAKVSTPEAKPIAVAEIEKESAAALCVSPDLLDTGSPAATPSCVSPGLWEQYNHPSEAEGAPISPVVTAFQSDRRKHRFNKVEYAGVSRQEKEEGVDHGAPSDVSLASNLAYWKKWLVECIHEGGDIHNFDWLTGSFHPSYKKPRHAESTFPQLLDDVSHAPNVRAALAIKTLVGRSVDAVARFALDALNTSDVLTCEVAEKLKLATIAVLSWGYKCPSGLDALVDLHVSNVVGDEKHQPLGKSRNLVYLSSEPCINFYNPQKSTFVSRSDGKRRKVVVEESRESISLSTLGGRVVEAYLTLGRPHLLNQVGEAKKTTQFLLDSDGHALTLQEAPKMWDKGFAVVLHGWGIPWGNLTTKEQQEFYSTYFPHTSEPLRHLYAFLASQMAKETWGDYASFMDISLKEFKRTYKHWPCGGQDQGKAAKAALVEAWLKAYPPST
eukprot:gene27582-7217_t